MKLKKEKEKQKQKQIKGKKYKFRDIRIGWKYGITLAIVIILFIGSSVFVSNSIMGIGKEIKELDSKSDVAMNIAEMGSLTRNMSVYIVSYYQEQDPDLIEVFKENQVEYNKLASDVRLIINTKEQEELFQQITSNNQELYRIFTNYLVNALKSENTRSAESYLEQTSEIREQTIDLLDQLVATVDADRKSAMDQAIESQRQTIVTQIIFLSITIVSGIILAIFISRIISRNLKKLVQVSNRIAEGDLTVTDIDYVGNDEIGQLANSINRMNLYLKDIIHQVSTVSNTVTAQSEELMHAANEVSTGAEQVVSTMQELAAGSEKQADSASNLAHTMQNFSTKVQEANVNGDRIQHSSISVLELAGQGSNLMQKSGTQMGRIDEIVKEAVSKVRGLDENSKEIGQLVGVIYDIADQTNLLALNAAIEAARAGEHGKGFAVVADEVRRLSEQVATSVSDITDIVKKIQKETSEVTVALESGYQEVQQGTTQITHTSATFNEINKAITDMVNSIRVVKQNLMDIADTTQLMGSSVEEIAAISEESAAGIEQTSASTQATSSSMEEMTRSSEDLAKLADQLHSLVGQFKI
ncbi:methyl-accepting chemotaxis protein [Ornithinibacillus scapharcae]|uniref:methyl-accepting chemotaxis protein n=1 Tax=Ornithinibacillus scapharcae TaxID=1147159 RepID=UPI000225AE1F|nr:HAMP domain-containing methyl-accepting chemotaxis protein [Ornithinibacillus scapharcae]